jgi:cytochrome oxidase Cu insertion factor (SCO1/SenC/PrrC family)
MMRIAACALLVMASMFCCGLAPAAEQGQPSAAQMMDDLMYGHGPIGGPFTLTDQNGKPRRDIDFRGKLMIVYFGYTFCPDVCPADLMSITQALEALGPTAESVQPVHHRSRARRKGAGGIPRRLPSELRRAYRFAGTDPEGGQFLQGILRQDAG